MGAGRFAPGPDHAGERGQVIWGLQGGRKPSFRSGHGTCTGTQAGEVWEPLRGRVREGRESSKQTKGVTVGSPRGILRGDLRSGGPEESLEGC